MQVMQFDFVVCAVNHSGTMFFFFFFRNIREFTGYNLNVQYDTMYLFWRR